MKINIKFPANIRQPLATDVWFLDKADNWSVKRLCDDLCFDARIKDHHLEVNGRRLTETASVFDVLTEGATVHVVED